MMARLFFLPDSPPPSQKTAEVSERTLCLPINTVGDLVLLPSLRIIPPHFLIFLSCSDRLSFFQNPSPSKCRMSCGLFSRISHASPPFRTFLPPNNLKELFPPFPSFPNTPPSDVIPHCSSYEFPSFIKLIFDSSTGRSSLIRTPLHVLEP